MHLLKFVDLSWQSHSWMRISIFVFFNQMLMLGYMMVGSLAFVFWLIPIAFESFSFSIHDLRVWSDSISYESFSFSINDLRLFSLPEPLRWNKDPLHLSSKWGESQFSNRVDHMLQAPINWSSVPAGFSLDYNLLCLYIGNVEELNSIKKSSHLTVKLYFLQYLERTIFPIWIITWCGKCRAKIQVLFISDCPIQMIFFKMQLAFSFCAGKVELRRCRLCGSSSEQRVKIDYDMVVTYALSFVRTETKAISLLVDIVS